MRRSLLILIGSALIAVMLALGSSGVATGQEQQACGEEKAKAGLEPAIVFPPDPSIECDTNFSGFDEAYFSEGAEERDPSADEAIFGNFCEGIFVPEECLVFEA